MKQLFGLLKFKLVVLLFTLEAGDRALIYINLQFHVCILFLDVSHLVTE